jgi:hypothetical protein
MEEIYRSQFRMPQELYEQLKVAADGNKRSVNAELVARLEESFKTKVPLEAVDEMARRAFSTIEQLSARLDALEAEKRRSRTGAEDVNVTTKK